MANNQSLTALEDTPIAITLSGIDADGNTLNYRIVSNPTHGTLSGTGANQTYTPNADFNGEDAFTFVANDNAFDSNIATVSLTLSPVNDAPVITGSPLNAIQGQVYRFTPSVSDADSGDSRSFAITGPLWLTLNAATGELSGTPANADVGTTNMTLTVTDSSGLSDSLIFALTVTNTNDAPIANPDIATVNEDGSVMIAVLSNDSDPDGDAMVVTSATATQGSVTINADNTLSYTPNLNINGTDTISYQIRDTLELTASSTVTVTINLLRQLVTKPP